MMVRWAVILLVPGCAPPSAEAVNVSVAPPASLTAPCAAPVGLPDRALSDRDIEVFWGRDRSALRACGSRHQGLAGWAVAAP